MIQPTFFYRLQGNLTSKKAFEVKQQLSSLVEQGNHHLLLDLTTVENVDIVGVNALVHTCKMIRSHGGSMQLTLCRNGQLAKMLHITKFDRLLTFTHK